MRNLFLTATLLAALAAPATAQTVSKAKPAPASGGISADAALNRAVVAQDDKTEARNRAARAEYDRRLAEQKAAQMKYEADLAAWKARVAACKAGDRSQCSK